jgi:hypothetical protein
MVTSPPPMRSARNPSVTGGGQYVLNGDPDLLHGTLGVADFGEGQSNGELQDFISRFDQPHESSFFPVVHGNIQVRP